MRSNWTYLMVLGLACVSCHPKESDLGESTVLAGSKGKVWLNLPKDMQFAVYTDVDLKKDSQRAYTDIRLPDIKRFVSTRTKYKIDKLVKLSNKRVEQSFIEHGLSYKLGLADPDYCLYPQLFIYSFNKVSRPKAIAKAFPDHTDMIKKPISRYGMTAYVRKQDIRYINSRKALIAKYRTEPSSISESLYIKNDRLNRETAINCYNEFGRGWGLCSVETDITPLVSISYKQCLALLPDSEFVRSVMESIVRDLLVKEVKD